MIINDALKFSEDNGVKIISSSLTIGVDQKDPYENLFQEQYSIALHQDFILKKEAKKHNINSHSQWMRDSIKLNHEPNELVEINKRKIVYVQFGMNVGTEINGIRPAVIYKPDEYRF